MRFVYNAGVKKASKKVNFFEKLNQNPKNHRRAKFQNYFLNCLKIFKNITFF